MSKPEHFCDWHIEPSDKPGELYCSAHLAEGRCLKCSYKLKDIQYGPKFGKKLGLYISHTESPLVGACQDFEPVKNLLELLGISSFDKLLKEKPYFGSD